MRKIEPYKGIAWIYDEIRPDYPNPLIEEIITITQITKENHLLEIGAGTGKATLPFADRGFNIQAIELGVDMAEVFKEKFKDYPNVNLDISPFENWGSHEKYKLIYCAQAFHWLNPLVKYQKCYDLLNDEGYLALFWYQPVSVLNEDLDLQIDQLIEDYKKEIGYIGKEERATHLGKTSKVAWQEEIEASGLFDILMFKEYTGEIKNDAKKYVKVKKSIPTVASLYDHLDENKALELDQQIEDLINKNGGQINTIFNYMLYIARKKV